MAENLNHWAFVMAAYVLAVFGTAALVGSSLLAMRKAEARKDRTRES